MRVSNYVKDIEINQNTRMIYSTASREYYLYKVENREKIYSLLENVNKGEYTKSEIRVIKSLLNKKILISDDFNEIEDLYLQENVSRYQNNVFNIMIVVTNACNFRCSYCIQEHETKNLDLESEEKIINLLSNVSKKVRKIKVAWFGGEPLLQYESIKRITSPTKKICQESNCELELSMATNAYLLGKDMAKDLSELGFSSIQITIDGNKEYHDSRRILANGEGTYDIVYSNLINLLETKISIILRINVDAENLASTDELLESIPLKYRNRVTISVSNLYQTEKKLSVAEIYKKAINLGYNYAGRKNKYIACQACQTNGFIVDTNANIIICTNAEEPRELGFIDKDGEIHIKNLAKYNRLKFVSAIQNTECQKCVELPFCIGTCKYRRSIENNKCIGKKGDGLTIEEHAILDYLYDEKRKEEKH
ncbi:MAG: radical SAM protein [Roseburia sp.]